MIDPKSIGFDIDGVVADTMPLFLEIARKEHGVNHIRYEDMTCYILQDCLDMDEKIVKAVLIKLLEGSYDEGLHPMDHAVDVLTRLGSAYGPLRFVTARPDRKPILRWMERQLPFDKDGLDIVATGSFEAKADVLLEKEISFFVEDRLDTCFLLADIGITPILYIQPWNRDPHPFTEVTGWKDLERLIAFE